MTVLSDSIRLNIRLRLEKGESVRATASAVGVSATSVHRVRKELDLVIPTSVGGRPPVLSETDKRSVRRFLTSGKGDTAVQAALDLGLAKGAQIGAQTVRRALRESGLRAKAKVKKPLLTVAHKAARLAFARDHIHWTMDDWKRVVWSDETKINRFGSDGRQWVWDERGKPLCDRTVSGTVKFGGGSLMVWGCMTFEGIGWLRFVEGRMDAVQYCDILGDALLVTLEHYNMETKSILFQQDNDPKHTSNLARQWFQDHRMRVMHWPAQSPDLNPIEHLWEHLKRQLAGYETECNGMLQLQERIEEQWPKITAEVCKNLISSMPRRLESVIKAKGGNTKY